ncbi:YveK family protein [Loigolactobacillus binensis]|uniref:Polysaccharide chain length determinant N-terminal domain-containing protein n=1 Tax=Loigolactobacillus binensis TaxID=2559922 RepID=A0ABW3E993_9LACO|nr:hypothetical protein [Loigolactobacillus binensis]
MRQASRTLSQFLRLVRGLIIMGFIGGILGLLVSGLLPTTPAYQSQVLISLATVQRDKYGARQYLNYVSGTTLVAPFCRNFNTPTTTQALQQTVQKAGLATNAAADATKITVTPRGNLVQVSVTSRTANSAVKLTNLAARLAVRTFRQQAHVQGRLLGSATNAQRQATTTSRGENILKFIFAGILLGFLWLFLQELWQRHGISK